MKKNKITKKMIVCAFFVFTVLVLIFSNDFFGETSIFKRSISNNNLVNALYHKIPALLQNILAIEAALLVSWLLRIVMRKAFSKNRRGITIAKLLESCIKWILAIVIILVVLGSWGVDTGTLLASAGLLTLVVGLGAQSLVADIVAGMFIVFEGEYQVDDIVIIDDWRGTVLEIGIRTTKLVDAGGNVKIINNSEIKSVINQTQALSLAQCTVSVSYEESLARVERVISEALDEMNRQIPDIVEGPFYKGVSALADSGVELLIVAKCKEENFFQVERDLNRAMKLLFDANKIEIPYPQIVVNHPYDSGK